MLNISKIERALREKWEEAQCSPSVKKILITVYKIGVPVWVGEFHAQGVDEYDVVFIKSGQFAAWLRKQVQKLVDEGADSFKVELLTLDRCTTYEHTLPHSAPI